MDSRVSRKIAGPLSARVSPVPARLMAFNVAIDWPYVSQGFVNGVSLYSVTPLVISLLRRRRVDGHVWRTACAAGAFLGGFRLMRQLLQELQKRLRKDSEIYRLVQNYKNFIAGACATAFGLTVDDAWLGSWLVIWWAIRAVRCASPSIPHLPTFWMCVSSAIVNPAAFLFKDEHQPSYQKFMERMTLGVDRSTILVPPAVIPGPGLHGWDRLTYCDQLAQKGGHSTGSCTHAVATWVMPRIFLIALKLYGPLYLAWSFFKLRWPHVHVFESIIRSSVFLTLYTCWQYWSVMLWTSTVSPTVTRAQHTSFAWVSGLVTLLERKERRPELATYTMAHALNALYQRAKKEGHFTHTPKPISYLVLVISSGVLTHFHRQHASFVRTIFGFEEHEHDGESAPLCPLQQQ